MKKSNRSSGEYLIWLKFLLAVRIFAIHIQNLKFDSWFKLKIFLKNLTTFQEKSLRSWQMFQENVTFYSGKSADFYSKILQFLQNSQFLQKKSLDFPVKFIKFSHKKLVHFFEKIEKLSWKIIGKFYNFSKKFCRFLQERFMIFIGKLQFFY